MFKTGTLVGASRWPNRDAHPDFWHKPLSGQVLDFCDVRAWANSIHFPEDNPHPGAVMSTALRLREEGMLDGLVPVLWEAGGQRRVMWERESAVRPYEEDVVLWKAARAMRLDELRHPRRRKRRELRDFLPPPQRGLAFG